MSPCDTCVYFDYDEESDERVCCKSLDEDEYERFTSRHVTDCPYYRTYDEYSTVRKQN